MEKKNEKFSWGWMIFVAPWACALAIILGSICCLTLVGIPCGIKYFKLIKILFLPTDKTVVYRPNAKKRALNIYWSIFGGYAIRAIFSFAARVLRLFKAGVWLSLGIDKIYAYIKNPFGTEIVDYGIYTHQRNTMYDYTLLQRKICKNPDVKIFDDMRGRPVTVKKYLERLEDEVMGIKKPANIIFFLAISVSIFGFASLVIIPAIGIGLILCSFITCIIVAEYRSHQFLRFYDKQMRKLFKLYGNDAPFDESTAGIKPSYVFEHLAEVRMQNKKNSIKKAAERAAIERAKKEEAEKLNKEKNQTK